MDRRRVAVVISHPIQHFCPQYCSWASLPGVELRVFFASRHGLAAYEDKNFSRVVKWDGLRLDFAHEFLHGAEERPVDRRIDSPDLDGRLAAFSPHVVVAYGYSHALQRHVLRWAESACVPVLMFSDSELRRARGWTRRAAKAILLPPIYRKAALFLTVGDANEAYYRNYGVADHQFVRCFYPIDIRHYDSVVAHREESRNRIRSQLTIPAHHRVVLMVGKLVPWKRQADLVLFSNAMQEGHPDITVVLVGTGPDEDSLRAKACRMGAGGVLFAGFVSPEDLAEYYCAADVYVHCSDWEPHSVAISEAIYCGLPVVLSNRCGSYGPTDDVQPGINGFVYRCGDIRHMSQHLLPLLSKGDLHVRMGKASMRIGREHQALAHGVALTQALSLIDSEQRA